MSLWRRREPPARVVAPKTGRIKSAINSFKTLADQSTTALKNTTTGQQLMSTIGGGESEGLLKAIQQMISTAESLTQLPIANVGNKSLALLLFGFIFGGGLLLLLKYWLRKKLLLEKHKLYLERTVITNSSSQLTSANTTHHDYSWQHESA